MYAASGVLLPFVSGFALVPAAVMSIGAANTFTRNIWKPFIHPAMTPREESVLAKLASLVVKVGALVNSAGLAASRVARAIEGSGAVPETLYAKGNYFALYGRAPFRRLVYPAPQTHGLGVHLTFDLGGLVIYSCMTCE